MRLHHTLTLFVLLIALGGCSRYSEGDKVFLDLTEGGIEQSAYIEATVLDEAKDKVTVRVDTLHCEADCRTLPSTRISRLAPGHQAVFAVDEVQPWTVGKAAYDERIHAYQALLEQRQQRGVFYRVDPPLLASARLVMQRDGFSAVLDIIDLAELERQHFTDSGGEMLLREVIEAFPAFLAALRERLKGQGLYQDVRRLRTRADLAILSGNPAHLYLMTLFDELEALQGLYLQYLLPKGGDDMGAMSLHFRYVDTELAASASRALADFFSDDCQYLPAGQGCEAYRASFRQRAMHQLVSRLRDNLAREVAGKRLPTAQARVNESMSLFRFILNLRGKFSGETLLEREAIDRLVRENAR